MTRGEIFFRRNFQFSDGDKSNKLLLALNTPSDNAPLLVILTTAQSHSRKAISGCHAKDNYFFMEKGHDNFPEDTWFLFETITPLDYRQILQWSLCERNLETKGCLRLETMNAIINCIKQSLDIPLQYLPLLQ